MVVDAVIGEPVSALVRCEQGIYWEFFEFRREICRFGLEYHTNFKGFGTNSLIVGTGKCKCASRELECQKLGREMI